MKLTSLQELPTLTVSHNSAIKKKVMLQFGDLPHLTNFSQATFAPGHVAQAHFHSDMYEVFFVESGEGTICIDDRNYILKPGSCVTVEPGETHEIINNGTTDLVLTYFGLQVEPK
jgi:mannose-6-phosphate isomerase-like protein (cupin superfamily)